MKNGIAINEKTLIPETIRWKAIIKGKPSKAKADKAVRHDEILQSLMDELEAENNPTKTEFETISPADLLKMSKEDKKQYLDKYLKWYATDASSEKATAGSASVSLNC